MELCRKSALVLAFLVVICDVNGNRQERAVTRTQMTTFLPNIENILSRCENQNGAAVEKIHNEWQNSVACLRPSVDSFTTSGRNIAEDIVNLSDMQRLRLEFQNVCGLTSKAKTCFKTTLDAMKKCLTSQEEANVNTIWNTIFAGTEFICRDNGAKYIEFLENDAEQCFRLRQKGLQKCTDGLVNFVMNSTEEFLMFNKKNCKVISETSSCMVNEFSQCPNKKAVTTIQEFFHVTLHKLPCDKHGSNAAPVAVCNKWIFALVPMLATLSVL